MPKAIDIVASPTFLFYIILIVVVILTIVSSYIYDTSQPLPGSSFNFGSTASFPDAYPQISPPPTTAPEQLECLRLCADEVGALSPCPDVAIQKCNNNNDCLSCTAPYNLPISCQEPSSTIKDQQKKLGNESDKYCLVEKHACAGSTDPTKLQTCNSDSDCAVCDDLDNSDIGESMICQAVPDKATLTTVTANGYGTKTIENVPAGRYCLPKLKTCDYTTGSAVWTSLGWKCECNKFGSLFGGEDCSKMIACSNNLTTSWSSDKQQLLANINNPDTGTKIGDKWTPDSLIDPLACHDENGKPVSCDTRGSQRNAVCQCDGIAAGDLRTFTTVKGNPLVCMPDQCYGNAFGGRFMSSIPPKYSLSSLLWHTITPKVTWTGDAEEWGCLAGIWHFRDQDPSTKVYGSFKLIKLPYNPKETANHNYKLVNVDREANLKNDFFIEDGALFAPPVLMSGYYSNDHGKTFKELAIQTDLTNPSVCERKSGQACAAVHASCRGAVYFATQFDGNTSKKLLLVNDNFSDIQEAVQVSLWYIPIQNKIGYGKITLSANKPNNSTSLRFSYDIATKNMLVFIKQGYIWVLTGAITLLTIDKKTDIYVAPLNITMNNPVTDVNIHYKNVDNEDSAEIYLQLGSNYLIGDKGNITQVPESEVTNYGTWILTPTGEHSQPEGTPAHQPETQCVCSGRGSVLWEFDKNKVSSDTNGYIWRGRCNEETLPQSSITLPAEGADWEGCSQPANTRSGQTLLVPGGGGGVHSTCVVDPCIGDYADPYYTSPNQDGTFDFGTGTCNCTKPDDGWNNYIFPNGSCDRDVNPVCSLCVNACQTEVSCPKYWGTNQNCSSCHTDNQGNRVCECSAADTLCVELTGGFCVDALRYNDTPCSGMYPLMTSQDAEKVCDGKYKCRAYEKHNEPIPGNPAIYWYEQLCGG